MWMPMSTNIHTARCTINPRCFDTKLDNASFPTTNAVAGCELGALFWHRRKSLIFPIFVDTSSAINLFFDQLYSFQLRV